MGLGGNRLADRLARLGAGKLAPIGLLEAGLFAFGFDLSGARQSKGWLRASCRRGSPIALVGHGGDHLLAVQGLAGFA